MKRVVAAYKVQDGQRMFYDSWSDIQKQLKQQIGGSTFEDIHNYVDNNGPLVLAVQMASGEGTISFGVEGSTCMVTLCAADGTKLYEVRYSKLLYDPQPLDAILRASPKNLSKTTDPAYQREQRRKQSIRDNRKKSIDELVDSMQVLWGISDKIAADALRQLRDKLTDDDYAIVSRWSLRLVDKKHESWASPSLQAYGYTTDYILELDTGVNTYQTTVHDNIGWHTE